MPHRAPYGGGAQRNPKARMNAERPSNHRGFVRSFAVSRATASGWPRPAAYRSVARPLESAPARVQPARSPASPQSPASCRPPPRPLMVSCNHARSRCEIQAIATCGAGCAWGRGRVTAPRHDSFEQRRAVELRVSFAARASLHRAMFSRRHRRGASYCFSAVRQPGRAVCCDSRIRDIGPDAQPAACSIVEGCGQDKTRHA